MVLSHVITANESIVSNTLDELNAIYPKKTIKQHKIDNVCNEI